MKNRVLHNADTDQARFVSVAESDRLERTGLIVCCSDCSDGGHEVFHPALDAAWCGRCLGVFAENEKHACQSLKMRRPNPMRLSS